MPAFGRDVSRVRSGARSTGGVRDCVMFNSHPYTPIMKSPTSPFSWNQRSPHSHLHTTHEQSRGRVCTVHGARVDGVCHGGAHPSGMQRVLVSSASLGNRRAVVVVVPLAGRRLGRPTASASVGGPASHRPARTSAIVLWFELYACAANVLPTTFLRPPYLGFGCAARRRRRGHWLDRIWRGMQARGAFAV